MVFYACAARQLFHELQYQGLGLRCLQLPVSVLHSGLFMLERHELDVLLPGRECQEERLASGLWSRGTRVYVLNTALRFGWIS